MTQFKVEFLPQRHVGNDADPSKVDREVLESQVRIARHLLKNRDAFIFVEGRPPNLPAALSPWRYHACSTRRYDPVRCGYKSIWRSIRASQIYFRKFDVKKDILGEGTGAVLKDRGFQTSIVAMGAPAFLFFVGAVKYVIFSDSAKLLDRVSREQKLLQQLFGDISGCFDTIPQSKLNRVKFTDREKHVLKVLGHFASRFPDKKRILVFGARHNFTKYNGSRFQFAVPKEFTSEAAYGNRSRKELSTTCRDMLFHSIVLGVWEFVEWIKKMLRHFW